MWSSFFNGFSVLIFFVDNYTLLSTLYFFSTFFLCRSATTACFSWLQAIFFLTNSYTPSILTAIDWALLLASRLRVNSSDRFTGLKLILGIYTRVVWNSGILVEADGLALAANLAIGSKLIQSFWKWFTYAQRCFSIFWLAILLWPFISRWNAVESLALVFSILHRAFHIAETNWRPQLDTILVSNLCLFQMFCTSILAVTSAFIPLS